ncbi:uncharacterized protein E0L32_003480 [Thyridium curvatum]|uniref:Zn(2)-C6 fungal-type domain-containing protein n=1 Tax=Thyridium curvatum TaxID=1093900 RepID=A0A507BJP9_9PEZI|nr:uncharacterized protein E0L32_003480 [Thyridium curvatum]TPX16918.1 hypothetical protein E0L32_003480 [Thyridium curvatum]
MERPEATHLPAPPVRSRNGCFTCRRRKKKCNEEKPVCIGCKRNKLDCHWPSVAPKPSSSARGDLRKPTPSTTASSRGDTQTSSAGRRRESAPAATGLRYIEPRISGVPTTHSPSQWSARLQQIPSPAFGPRPDHEAASATTATAVSLENTVDLVTSLLDPSCFTLPLSTSEADLDLIGNDGLDGELLAPPPLAAGLDPSTSPFSSSPDIPLASADNIQSASTEVIAAENDQLFSLDGADFADDALITTSESVFDSSLLPTLLTPPLQPSLGLLPDQSHQSMELLSYYLSKTVNSMGNGSTDVNPFVTKLIPLAFSNSLVLQLILAQSAAHRQAWAHSAHTDSANEVAHQSYSKSLSSFRGVLSDYANGREQNVLVVTVGSLVLCLTEVARGDVHGVVFDHLSASKTLLKVLLSQPSSSSLQDLPDFLVEYYVHMAATSMISVDVRYTRQTMMTPEIDQKVLQLVENKYIGQLGGCWIELLYLITQIFALGQSMLGSSGGSESTAAPSPSDIITFGLLQSQIMAYCPDPSARPNSQLAALVFKQAVLLYLWTLIGNPHQGDANTDTHKALIDGAVAEALLSLQQLPVSDRVNTSLCWPLAVIGCCTSSDAVKEIIRARLRAMSETIGLGNMRETLVLLETVWTQPLEETSPWNLCRVMGEYQMWISFA